MPVLLTREAPIGFLLAASESFGSDGEGGALLGRRPEYELGDQVSHFREPGNVGTVVRIERRGVLFRRWVYFVQWREGVDPVPVPRGLWRVPDVDWGSLPVAEIDCVTRDTCSGSDS